MPAMVRWPGKIKPRTEINEVISSLDWVPTRMAAAGEPNLTAELLTGNHVGGKTCKVHLDGYDQGDLCRQGDIAAPRVHLLDRRQRYAGHTYRPGKWCSWNRAPRDGALARTPDPLRMPKIFICGRTRSSARSTRRATISGGSSSTPT